MIEPRKRDDSDGGTEADLRSTIADLDACLANGHVFPLTDTRAFQIHGPLQLVEGPTGPALVGTGESLIGGGFTCPRCATTFANRYGTGVPVGERP